MKIRQLHTFTTQVRLGQSMLEILFRSETEDKVNSSTTQVRLGQSMLDNNFV